MRVADAAARYLEEQHRLRRGKKLGRLKATTLRDRGYQLKPGSRLVGFFGESALDDITSARLGAYQGSNNGLTEVTFWQDIATLAAVLRFARHAGYRYAKYVPDGDWVDPIRLKRWQLPADLLATPADLSSDLSREDLEEDAMGSADVA